MPSINVTFGQAGPLIQAHIGLSGPRRQVLLAAGQPVARFVVGTFLVDTGASTTCVDPALVAPLGLTPTGTVMMQTPSTAGTPHSCYQYDVTVFIPGSRQSDPGFVIDALPVSETHLRSQGIDGLIGRDVIDRCVLIHNGPMGWLTISF